MDAGVFLRGLGIACAFLCGAGLSSLLAARLRVAPAAARAHGRGAGLQRLLRRGVPAARPCARALLRCAPVRDLAQEGVWACEARGAATTSEALLSVALAAMALAALAAGLAAGTLLAALAVAVCAAACAAVWLRGERDARREDARDAVPEVLRSMGACFRSGYSLLQTFRQVADEGSGATARQFRQAAHRLEVGQPPSQALAALREGAAVPELAFVAVALDVQRQTGGSMQRVLDAAGQTVESQIELARSLRVQTAQARLSAQVVSAMPFVLVAVLSVMDKDYLAPFFSGAAGFALLALALALEAAGVVLVQRMLRVDVA